MNSKSGRSLVTRGLIGASLALHVALSTAFAQAPPSAALLKRIAEAVDGVRTGDTVYVVVSQVFPFRIDTIAKSREVATSRARAAGSGYGVHGPFLTTRDANQPPKLLMICHQWDSSPCDSSFNSSLASQWRMSEVDSVTVYAYRGRDRQGGLIRGRSPDAFFLSLAAWDKLYYPYLVRVYGSGYADRRRAQLLQSLGGGPSELPR